MQQDKGFRAFIALNLPDEISKSLGQTQAAIQESFRDLNLRWVPYKNIHLTMKFLGQISAKQVTNLETILATNAKNYPPFEIALSQIQVFPSLDHPRGIWAAAQIPDQLFRFQSSLDKSLLQSGFRSDKKMFSPHLTLGRFRHGALIKEKQLLSDFVTNLNLGAMQSVKLNELVLYRSDLFPSGAVYTQLITAQLEKFS